MSEKDFFGLFVLNPEMVIFSITGGEPCHNWTPSQSDSVLAIMDQITVFIKNPQERTKLRLELFYATEMSSFH